MKNYLSPFAQVQAISVPNKSFRAQNLFMGGTSALRLFGRTAVVVCCVACAGVASAATASFRTGAPTLGPSDIAQLTVASDRTNNVGGTLNDQGGNFVYLDNGRPAQGQTFTTGGNANGYSLTAVTLKQVAYETYALVPDMTYHIRITSPSGTALTVLAEETAFVPQDLTDCSTCNFMNNGCCSFLPGSGRYITFTLATPVVLLPNTVYGFDIGATSVGDHYWETDGSANPLSYAGGTAYSTGVAGNDYGNGLGNDTITERIGDRVFVVALTAATTPIAPHFDIQPNSISLYASRTAQFSAKVSGSPPLIYQWQKNGVNVLNGGNISGATTDSLTIANVAAGDAGSYTLVVTNSASTGNSITSTPAILTVVSAPAAGTYAYSVLTNNPAAFWRLDEMSDSATNPPAHDYAGGGGFNGIYEVGASNGFSGIVGPRPSAFPGFESTNNAVQTTGLGDGLTPTWVTIPPLNLNTNGVTMTAWIYPQGGQEDYCGLFEVGGGDAGLAYGGGANAGQLMYWWAGGGWDFVSGLVIPPNQWSFVAVVIEPTKATLYLGTNANGALSTAANIATHDSQLFGAIGQIGHQPGRAPDSRAFYGLIDEVAVFQRSLSFDEINGLNAVARGVTPIAPPTITAQPISKALYPGRTARFVTSATGSAPLTYQWRKNGVNLVNGGNVSGATSDSLTIANVGTGDVGTYTLVVTNLALSQNIVTSAPATLRVVALPAPGTYAYGVLANNPIAHWRLDETVNPTGNPLAYDYVGGIDGIYEVGSSNGFNGIAGPRLSAFPGFESTNNAVQTSGVGDSTTPTWVTLPALNLNTNRVTMTAWIYPQGVQNDYCGLFEIGGGDAGLAYGGSFSLNENQLIHWWQGDGWDLVSGLVIPPDQWSFVAVAIEPTKATLYLGTNGVLSSWEHVSSYASQPFDAIAQLGHQPGRGPDSRVFNGSIDEVSVFNYTFTPAQMLDLYNTATSVTLTIQKVGANVTVAWPQGTLLEATTIAGPYVTNNNVSPYTFAPTGTAKYFRVQVR